MSASVVFNRFRRAGAGFPGFANEGWARATGWFGTMT